MKLTDAFLMEGASGKMGEFVFYQKNGNTFVRKSAAPSDKLPTEKQMISRERFILAHQFAQTVINDPALKALYQKMAGSAKKSAYNKAVSEFMLNRH